MHVIISPFAAMLIPHIYVSMNVSSWSVYKFNLLKTQRFNCVLRKMVHLTLSTRYPWAMTLKQVNNNNINMEKREGEVESFQFLSKYFYWIIVYLTQKIPPLRRPIFFFYSLSWDKVRIFVFIFSNTFLMSDVYHLIVV